MQWCLSLRNGTKQIRILVTLLRGHIFLHMTFTKGMPHTAGTSATLLITTSSISFHTALDMNNKDKGVGYLDIFSCKHFTYDQVYLNLKKHFNDPTIIRWQILER